MKWFYLYVGVFLSITATSTWATQKHCQVPNPTVIPPHNDPLNALAAELDAKKKNCLSSPAWLAWYASILNAVGRHLEAADQLELALLLAPETSGLSEAYRRTLALINQGSLATKYSPPTDLTAQNSSSNTSLHSQLSFNYGRGDNISYSTREAQITLTLPSGSIVMPLAETSQSQSGTLAEALFSARTLTTLSQGKRLSFASELHARRATKNVANANFKRTQLQAEITTPLSQANEAGILMGISQQNYDDGTQLNARQLHLRYATAAQQRCRPLLSLDINQQKQTDHPQYNSYYRGFSGILQCNQTASRSDYRLSWGQDNAPNDRPGGDQSRAILSASHERPLLSGKLQLNGAIHYQKDAEGYSIWLAHDAARKINRLELNLEYIHPLPKAWQNWQAHMRIESLKQNSNIALFNVNSSTLWLGITRVW